MPPRSRYAVDPSLQGQPQSQQQFQQQQYSQQPYPTLNQDPHLHQGADGRTQASTGEYAPVQQQHHQYGQSLQTSGSASYGHGHGALSGPPDHYGKPQPQSGLEQTQQFQPALGHSVVPPQHHIPAPPHSSGPALTGPRVRIDPSQMPNPIEAQEMDQNLWDDEDYLSCQSKGIIPLGGTDWRGVDQGNSLPRHIRPTLPTIPTNSQLLDTTALPFGLIIQPFATLRYDEAPIPVVSSFVSGQSAFDPLQESEEDVGPPRCDKCRGYINPWARWQDGGRKWGCNLCGNANAVSDLYFSHLGPTGQRLDHDSRPELQHGTVDFAVSKDYHAPQPPPSGSLLDSVTDTTTDALSSTASDLFTGLQASLGQGTSRGPTPTPGNRDREKEKKKDKRRVRKPAPISRVFVIDVSGPSIGRGIVREVCEGIRRAIYGSSKPEGINGGAEEQEEDEDIMARGERVAIVTVAETVGFWNLSPGLPAPTLMVVSDLDDMFIPLAGNSFLVDPQISRSQVEALLNLIPDMMEQQSEGIRVAAGSAIKGVLSGLRMLGGQINLYLSALPTVGLGKLTARDDPGSSGTDKEKALFGPADPFWRVTAEEMAECGVGVNLFLFPDQYTDVASVGALASITGGEVFFHPKFNPVRDRDTLHDEIKRVMVRETVYNATIRIRCSNGLRVADHIGNHYQRSMTDLEYGLIDESKAFAAALKHEGQRLDDRQPAFVQVAVLYTSSSGERRVRCLNLSLTTTSLIGNVFRFADLDAAVTLFVKDAVSQMPQKALKDIRTNLSNRCNRILLMYRKHCAPAVQQGQLILPESFKLLPLYTLCMLKCKPLKGGNVSSDVRSHYMRLIRSFSVVSTMNFLYPRLLAIHDLSEDVGFPGANGRLKLPRFMRASYAWMVAEGAYLMTNGEIAMIWFGGGVSPQIIDDIYGAESLQELDIRITRLPKLPTLLSTQLRNIITHLEGIVGHTLPVIMVRQNMDGTEIEFANMLVEDSNNDALSYADYLMTAHKSITNELSGSSGKEGWMPWSS
ncbi:hypothetical protein BD324DRAFT_678254 [Kockovaella imperatae]|uniref:Sec23/Sec24 trunk domain-domain-containing protein n=1 Tax=Kockovaella imperatae TaxID=4999 RepID=A0A1Y1UTI5_9TREE|nr:hypothetical protein BD324DRAFT_678254 [Kockovaella imperatae]ORX40834.1 hypothetical protein BD324DRAFT_678254 [Kockovaella imperatae]